MMNLYLTNLTQILKFHVDFRVIAEPAGWRYPIYQKIRNLLRIANKPLLSVEIDSPSFYESNGMFIMALLCTSLAIWSPRIWTKIHVSIAIDTSAWKYESWLSCEWNFHEYGPVVAEIEPFEVPSKKRTIVYILENPATKLSAGAPLFWVGKQSGGVPKNNNQHLH